MGRADPIGEGRLRLGGRGFFQPFGPGDSEALLAGIMLAHDPDSEPDRLRRHFGLSRSDLQDAGMSRLPDRGGSPASLDGMPPMGPAAEALLEKAAELTRSLNPEREKLIRIRDLFGGVLFVPDSHAYHLLQGALDKGRISLDDVQKIYPDFVALDSQSSNFEQFLAERLVAPAAPAFNVKARAISDPATDTDRLGFAPLVDGLDALLNNQETSLPLAVAITAPWGAGKSSVMLQLEGRLRDQAPHDHWRRGWYTVQFPAWKYERGERVWAALAQRINAIRDDRRQMSFWQRLRFDCAWPRSGWSAVRLLPRRWTSRSSQASSSPSSPAGSRP